VTADGIARSPLAHRHADLAAFAAATQGGVTASEAAFLAQVDVRVAPEDAPLSFPRDPNTVARRGAGSVLWLGPDEWLVTAPRGFAPDLIGRLHRALAERHATIVDLSASRAILEIAGPQARTLLQKGCGIDLHPRVFGPGQCAQTVFAKLPVIIDQSSAAPVYRLFVRRSAAHWLAQWLIDAADEFRFA
jgi:sarcosine oxidase, subunit gamma